MTDLEVFWASIWEFFDVRASAPYERVLLSRSMPGAKWFPAHASTTRSTSSARGRRTRSRSGTHRAGGRWPRRRGVSSRGDAAHRVGLARDRRAAGRPRRRLPPEHPRGDRRVPRLCEPRRDLVELLAGLRRAQCRRPLRADRAARALHRRRLPLRRPRPRPARGRRAPAASDADPRADRRPPLPRPRSEPRRPTGRDPVGRLPRGGRRGAARVRPGRLRPSALGALQLGDDRAAEGDRARTRRHPARAPQEAEPAHRSAGGRPPVLVHDDRLDDVELPRGRPAHRGLDRAVRRQPRAP